MSELFIGPFRVVRHLGAGGMGEVVLAEDARLGRLVALKCPSDTWLRSPEARARLQREARAAASLTHPGIAAVYDVLEVDGRPYIVMEYVEGETLSAALARGPFSVERALDVGIRLADVLAAAHAAGIVHRDLKPGNVMLTPDGQVKVLDFGLAKTRDPAADALTTPGQVLGTPGYVAPEQLLGRPADARSDIYGAGAILYELLTARTPVRQRAGEGHGLAALLEPVDDPATVNPDLPRAVCAAVMRALARDPADRFQSAAELGRALRAAAGTVRELPTGATSARPHRRAGAIATVAVVAVLCAGAGVPLVRWWRAAPSSPTSGAAATHARPVVAVLPLENRSDDRSLDYIGAGMADTMSTKLASLPAVSVVSRAEIHDALLKTPELSKVTRALGVSYAVTGSVQEAAGRLQVTINLLSPDGRTIISGDIYEDSVQHLFALQRRIAEDLTRRIVGTISAADHDRLARTPTTSVQAISAYWRGRDLMEQPGPEPIDPSIAAFTESTRDDPGFALGYAGLGSAYWRKYAQTKDPQWAGRAIDAAEHARQLDPDEPEVRIALATVYSGSGRTADAVAELRKALELQPANYDARVKLGDIEAEAGQATEAEADYEAAREIRPEYWWTYRQIGVLQMSTGRFAQAIQSFGKITALQPDSPLGYQLLGTVHGTMFDLDAATRDYEQAMAHGGSFGTYSSLGTVYYLQGRFDAAAKSYREAIALRPKSAKTYWNLGDACRHLRRTKEAAAAYREAVALSEADLRVNPNDGVAAAIRATCLARLGERDKAERASTEAVRLAPQNQDVQYHRAVVLMLAGRPEAAMAALHQAITDGYPVGLLQRDIDLAPLADTTGFSALVAAGDAAPGRKR